MAKFDARLKARGTTATKTSPVKASRTNTARTGLGGVGFVPDAKGELFKLLLANFVGESTYHEAVEARDDRFVKLVHQCALEDPVWTVQLARWARAEGYMRSAPLVVAAEFVRARLAANANLDEHRGLNRMIIDAVLQRPDEPSELLAYWFTNYGRAVPKPIKRGIADAVQRMYNEYSLLKYDGQSHTVRFGDVLELTHPDARDARQAELYKFAIDRRHNRDGNEYDSLRVINARRELESMSVLERRAWFKKMRGSNTLPELLNGAGMTWESLSGWLQGPMDQEAWEAIIPSMGYMALLRNLRNFDEAGVSDDVAMAIASKLADPDEVAKSRQFPFRFLAAYQNTHSLRWGAALERALNHSLSNVPTLKGNTLILVDRSGSMYTANGGALSDLSRADAAAVFGSALAQRAEKATLVEFGTGSNEVYFRQGESLLRMVTEKFTSLGGTNTALAINRHLRPEHNRVVIITDEQYGGSSYYAGRTASVDKAIPEKTPTYVWNLAGYRVGSIPSGTGNRHTFAGLSDAAFRMIGLLESSSSTGWPWEIAR